MLTVEEIKQKLIPIFDKNNINKAVVFGSYAKNQARANSDIDLLIDADESVRGFKFFGILDEVITTLGTKVDLVVQRHLINGDLLDREIKMTGVVIYERAN